MSESRPAGTFFANKIELHSLDPEDRWDHLPNNKIDLRPLVHTFTINESFTSGYMSGEMVVYDSAGVFYDVPLRGQELLHLELIDFYDKKYNGDFFIYSIDRVNPAKKSSDAILQYTLKFVSIGKFISERYTIRRCIAEGTGADRKYKPIHDQVQVVFDDYYKFRNSGDNAPIPLQAPLKEIEISETVGDQKIIIPYLSPDDAMHLFSRRAHSEEYPSDMFRFYETKENYYFKNIEELIEWEVPIETYTYTSGGMDNTPEAESEKMTNVLDIDLGEVVNTFRVMKEGGYYRSYTAMDLNYRFASTYTYDHYDEMINKKNFKYTDIHNPYGTNIRFNHTESFIQRHLDDRKRIFGIKDYADEGIGAPVERPDPKYPDIVNHKRSNLSQFDEYTVSISVYGQHKLTPGKMIYLDMPIFRTITDQVSRAEKQDKVKSGVYMITDVQNVFYENSYTQNLKLIKSGLSDNGDK